MIVINSPFYQQLLIDINSIILKGDRIFISIYSDSTGSQVINDVNGHPIDGKMFTSISYQYPAELSEGSLTIAFNDGCVININDNNDNYYYTVSGVTNGIAQLK